MAIRSVKNQYRGVNAHLHSYFQKYGGWTQFHTRYMVNLCDALKRQLLPMGYTADFDSSLQVRRIDSYFVEITRPRSDISIYDREPQRYERTSATALAPQTGELVLPIEALDIEPVAEKPYNAIRIYEVGAGEGSPVCWIEVLSPSNKPGGQDAATYFEKRTKILESGIVFIEVDFLHESPPTIRRLPPYVARPAFTSDFEPHPYRVMIVDPRPSLSDTFLRLREFDVDDPIPTMKVHLNGDDTLNIDFATPYHTVFENGLYGLERVDYAELPVNFDRYRDDDRMRILNKVLSLHQAVEAGIDIETGSSVVVSLSLKDALNEWEHVKTD